MSTLESAQRFYNGYGLIKIKRKIQAILNWFSNDEVNSF